MKDNEIVKILGVLAAAYPRFNLTEQTITAYTTFLRDMDAASLQAAAAQCATTRDFFPSVHELRQAVAELERKAAGLPTAYEAYEDACDAHKPYTLCGYDENHVYGERLIEYKWLHSLVERVARQLGWPGDFPGDTPGVDRAHFVKAWEMAVTEKQQDSLMLPAVRDYIEKRFKQLEAKNE